MKKQHISNEALNALIDNELDELEKVQLLRHIQADPSLHQKYQQLRHIKQWVKQAYQDVPVPKTELLPNRRYVGSTKLMLVAACFLAGSVYIGSHLAINNQSISVPAITTITELSTSGLVQSDRFLFHIKTNDDRQVRQVLAKAEEILKHSQQRHSPLNLEIVANASGLNVLRANSQYRDRIALLSQNYPNLRFLACGRAIKNAALIEQRDIELLPQAHEVPAALDQIVKRLEQGWTYVKI